MLLVSSNGVEKLEAESITSDIIGEKARGLAGLPSAWTLPFIVVSQSLFDDYRLNKSRDTLLQKWERSILEALAARGINKNDEIIVRSSGCSEGMGERGKFHSASGGVNNLIHPLSECLDRLIVDETTSVEKIPFVIQLFRGNAAAKGHLSNERRCYKEKRDWIGELELKALGTTSPFQINLRNWRKTINVADALNFPLSCELSAHISEVLKICAAWCSQQNVRVHFEWIWDNKHIFLVQADEERLLSGVDPVKQHKNRSYRPSFFREACLERVNKTHASKFAKIHNVFTYLELGLPITTLYILSDQNIITSLANHDLKPELRQDLEHLVKGSLVIRSDIATDDLGKRQLLPRSQEIRSLHDTIEWLTRQSKHLIETYPDDEIAFIFHNFIPSLASAFAYAAPQERNVQIEALWGLPEGLYYNSHDKYIVDTGIVDASFLTQKDVENFRLHERLNFKHFFVSADSNGSWITQVVAPPYDWRSSLRSEWCKSIALESRRIAAYEKRAVSIMWFAGLSEGLAESPVIPWYHEFFDARVAQRAITTRRKTAFDKSIVIRNRSDLGMLRHEAELSESRVRRIRIQPTDDALLRDKNTLKTIGSLACRLGAVIVLEGAVLSHAYYQLGGTGAVVEVVHPFTGFDERHEFNKLVRDNIPEGIEKVGELVTTARLHGEALIKALREKLVEEAFEVLDAADLESILGELADASEIIDELICQLGLTKRDLIARQTRKRRSRGGFKKGMVLLETKNPPPTAKSSDAEGSVLLGLGRETANNEKALGEQELQRLGSAIDRWTDRREDGKGVELKLRLQVPITRATWSGVTSEQRIPGAKGKIIKGEVKGKRNQSKCRIELSVFVYEEHPELF